MLPKQSPSPVNFSHEPPLNSPKIIAANPHQPQQPQNHCCQPPSTTTAPLPVTRSHTQHKPHHISHTTALSFNKTNLPKKINL